MKAIFVLFYVMAEVQSLEIAATLAHSVSYGKYWHLRAKKDFNCSIRL